MKEALQTILGMISDGKITADEGCKLLESMGFKQSFNSALDSTSAQELNDNLGAEIRGRISSIYSDVEPIFKRRCLSSLDAALETASIVQNAVWEKINESLRNIITN